MTAILLTHPKPVPVSLAFLLGVAAAAVTGTTIYFLLAGRINLGDPSDGTSTGRLIQYARSWDCCWRSQD